MKLFIQTFGCQMNVKDSEHIIAELSFPLTSNPKEADLIIINTCAVREKPVKKLFSELGALYKKNPNAKFGVVGCTASILGEEIIKKAPFVDFVVGARNKSQIKKAINEKKVVINDIDFDDTHYVYKNYRKNRFKDFVNIMIGCDKKCTYCVVPKTRGKELSIPMDIILKQVENLAKDGVKEITLLGQNVNNYGRRFSSKHPKVDFTDLLREVSKIDGIERIRFTSPHPLHADDKFLDEFANNPKICKHIHFPLQSGNNRILKLMKRGYTKEWYLNRIKILREIDEVAISTDIIVGFPTESEEEFYDTLDVIEKARFEQIFSFIYSPRPFTEALKYKELPKEISKKRLYTLQNLHSQILDEIAKSKIGKIYKVLVEEDGMGKSDNFFTVKFDKNPNIIGKIVDVEIINAKKHTLYGKVKE